MRLRLKLSETLYLKVIESNQSKWKTIIMLLNSNFQMQSLSCVKLRKFKLDKKRRKKTSCMLHLIFAIVKGEINIIFTVNEIYNNNQWSPSTFFSMILTLVWRFIVHISSFSKAVM